MFKKILSIILSISIVNPTGFIWAQGTAEVTVSETSDDDLELANEDNTNEVENVNNINIDEDRANLLNSFMTASWMLSSILGEFLDKAPELKKLDSILLYLYVSPFEHCEDPFNLKASKEANIDTLDTQIGNIHAILSKILNSQIKGTKILDQAPQILRPSGEKMPFVFLKEQGRHCRVKVPSFNSKLGDENYGTESLKTLVRDYNALDILSRIDSRSPISMQEIENYFMWLNFIESYRQVVSNKELNKELSLEKEVVGTIKNNSDIFLSEQMKNVSNFSKMFLKRINTTTTNYYFGSCKTKGQEQTQCFKASGLSQKVISKYKKFRILSSIPTGKNTTNKKRYLLNILKQSTMSLLYEKYNASNLIGDLYFEENNGEQKSTTKDPDKTGEEQISKENNGEQKSTTKDPDKTGEEQISKENNGEQKSLIDSIIKDPDQTEEEQIRKQVEVANKKANQNLDSEELKIRQDNEIKRVKNELAEIRSDLKEIEDELRRSKTMDVLLAVVEKMHNSNFVNNQLNDESIGNFITSDAVKNKIGKKGVDIKRFKNDVIETFYQLIGLYSNESYYSKEFTINTGKCSAQKEEGKSCYFINKKFIKDMVVSAFKDSITKIIATYCAESNDDPNLYLTKKVVDKFADLRNDKEFETNLTTLLESVQEDQIDTFNEFEIAKVASSSLDNISTSFLQDEGNSSPLKQEILSTQVESQMNTIHRTDYLFSSGYMSDREKLRDEKQKAQELRELDKDISDLRIEIEGIKKNIEAVTKQLEVVPGSNSPATIVDTLIIKIARIRENIQRLAKEGSEQKKIIDQIMSELEDKSKTIEYKQNYIKELQKRTTDKGTFEEFFELAKLLVDTQQQLNEQRLNVKALEKSKLKLEQDQAEKERVLAEAEAERIALRNAGRNYAAEYLPPFFYKPDIAYGLPTELDSANILEGYSLIKTGLRSIFNSYKTKNSYDVVPFMKFLEDKITQNIFYNNPKVEYPIAHLTAIAKRDIAGKVIPSEKISHVDATTLSRWIIDKMNEVLELDLSKDKKFLEQRMKTKISEVIATITQKKKMSHEAIWSDKYVSNYIAFFEAYKFAQARPQKVSEDYLRYISNKYLFLDFFDNSEISQFFNEWKGFIQKNPDKNIIKVKDLEESISNIPEVVERYIATMVDERIFTKNEITKLFSNDSEKQERVLSRFRKGSDTITFKDLRTFALDVLKEDEFDELKQFDVDRINIVNVFDATFDDVMRGYDDFSSITSFFSDIPLSRRYDIKAQVEAFDILVNALINIYGSIEDNNLRGVLFQNLNEALSNSFISSLSWRDHTLKANISEQQLRIILSSVGDFIQSLRFPQSTDVEKLKNFAKSLKEDSIVGNQDLRANFYKYFTTPRYEEVLGRKIAKDNGFSAIVSNHNILVRKIKSLSNESEEAFDNVAKVVSDKFSNIYDVDPYIDKLNPEIVLYNYIKDQFVVDNRTEQDLVRKLNADTTGIDLVASSPSGSPSVIHMQIPDLKLEPVITNKDGSQSFNENQEKQLDEYIRKNGINEKAYPVINALRTVLKKQLDMFNAYPNKSLVDLNAIVETVVDSRNIQDLVRELNEQIYRSSEEKVISLLNIKTLNVGSDGSLSFGSHQEQQLDEYIEKYNNLIKEKKVTGKKITEENYPVIKPLRAVLKQFDALSADPDVPYIQLGSTSEMSKVYVNFLAYLNWHINRVGERPDPNNVGNGISEANKSYLLKYFVEFLDIDLKDVNGWKKLLQEKSRPEDWIEMVSEISRGFVTSGPGLVLTTPQDLERVEVSFWKDRVEKPFPIVDQSEFNDIVFTDDFEEYFTRTQDSKYWLNQYSATNESIKVEAVRNIQAYVLGKMNPLEEDDIESLYEFEDQAAKDAVIKINKIRNTYVEFRDNLSRKYNTSYQGRFLESKKYDELKMELEGEQGFVAKIINILSDDASKLTGHEEFNDYNTLAKNEGRKKNLARAIFNASHITRIAIDIVADSSLKEVINKGTPEEKVRYKYFIFVDNNNRTIKRFTSSVLMKGEQFLSTENIMSKLSEVSRVKAFSRIYGTAVKDTIYKNIQDNLTDIGVLIKDVVKSSEQDVENEFDQLSKDDSFWSNIFGYLTRTNDSEGFGVSQTISWLASWGVSKKSLRYKLVKSQIDLFDNTRTALIGLGASKEDVDNIFTALSVKREHEKQDIEALISGLNLALLGLLVFGGILSGSGYSIGATVLGISNYGFVSWFSIECVYDWSTTYHWGGAKTQKEKELEDFEKIAYSIVKDPDNALVSAGAIIMENTKAKRREIEYNANGFLPNVFRLWMTGFTIQIVAPVLLRKIDAWALFRKVIRKGKDIELTEALGGATKDEAGNWVIGNQQYKEALLLDLRRELSDARTQLEIAEKTVAKAKAKVKVKVEKIEGLMEKYESCKARVGELEDIINTLDKQNLINEYHLYYMFVGKERGAVSRNTSLLLDFTGIPGVGYMYQSNRILADIQTAVRRNISYPNNEALISKIFDFRNHYMTNNNFVKKKEGFVQILVENHGASQEEVENVKSFMNLNFGIQPDDTPVRKMLKDIGEIYDLLSVKYTDREIVNIIAKASKPAVRRSVYRASTFGGYGFLKIKEESPNLRKLDEPVKVKNKNGDQFYVSYIQHDGIGALDDPASWYYIDAVSRERHTLQFLNMIVPDSEKSLMEGQEKLIKATRDVLGKEEYRAVVWTAEPGEGKSATLGRLANDLKGDNYVFYQLDLGSFENGTGIVGSGEQKADAMFNFFKAFSENEAAFAGKKPVLVIDEAHILVDVGKASGKTAPDSWFTAMLKVKLMKDVRLVAITTPDEFAKSIAKNPALRDRMTRLSLTLTVKDRETIVRSIAKLKGIFHNVEFGEEFIDRVLVALRDPKNEINIRQLSNLFDLIGSVMRDEAKQVLNRFKGSFDIDGIIKIFEDGMGFSMADGAIATKGINKLRSELATLELNIKKLATTRLTSTTQEGFSFLDALEELATTAKGPDFIPVIEALRGHKSLNFKALSNIFSNPDYTEGLKSILSKRQVAMPEDLLDTLSTLVKQTNGIVGSMETEVVNLKVKLITEINKIEGATQVDKMRLLNVFMRTDDKLSWDEIVEWAEAEKKDSTIISTTQWTPQSVSPSIFNQSALQIIEDDSYKGVVNIFKDVGGGSSSDVLGEDNVVIEEFGFDGAGI